MDLVRNEIRTLSPSHKTVIVKGNGVNSLSSSKRKGNSGRFEIGPIDAGYAREFANSLRRVLLSGLPGAAITSILIKNVQHEFQDIPHVKEDVVDIVQNIKKVRLRSYMDRAVHVRLDAQGESEVYAGPWHHRDREPQPAYCHP